MIKTEDFSLPARWASYLINNDKDDVASMKEAQDWVKKNPELGGCLTCGEQTYFSKTNDAGLDPAGGDCLDFTFVKLEKVRKANKDFGM